MFEHFNNGANTIPEFWYTNENLKKNNNKNTFIYSKSINKCIDLEIVQYFTKSIDLVQIKDFIFFKMSAKNTAF